MCEPRNVDQLIKKEIALINGFVFTRREQEQEAAAWR